MSVIATHAQAGVRATERLLVGLYSDVAASAVFGSAPTAGGAVGELAGVALSATSEGASGSAFVGGSGVVMGSVRPRTSAWTASTAPLLEPKRRRPRTAR